MNKFYSSIKGFQDWIEFQDFKCFTQVDIKSSYDCVAIENIKGRDLFFNLYPDGTIIIRLGSDGKSYHGLSSQKTKDTITNILEKVNAVPDTIRVSRYSICFRLETVTLDQLKTLFVNLLDVFQSFLSYDEIVEALKSCIKNHEGCELFNYLEEAHGRISLERMALIDDRGDFLKQQFVDKLEDKEKFILPLYIDLTIEDIVCYLNTIKKSFEEYNFG